MVEKSLRIDTKIHLEAVQETNKDQKNICSCKITALKTNQK